MVRKEEEEGEGEEREGEGEEREEEGKEREERERGKRGEGKGSYCCSKGVPHIHLSGGASAAV